MYLTSIKQIYALAQQIRTQQASQVVAQIKFGPLSKSQCAGVGIVYRTIAMGRLMCVRGTKHFFKQLAQGVVYFAVENATVNNRPLTGTVSFPRAKHADYRVTLAQRLNTLGPKVQLETVRLGRASCLKRIKQNAPSEAFSVARRAQSDKLLEAINARAARAQRAEAAKVLSWLSTTE